MNVSDRFEINLEGSEYESIRISGRHADWDISSADNDGDVLIECSHLNGTESRYLKQEELQAIVNFLQKQLK
jgi:Holliday junction resolvase